MRSRISRDMLENAASALSERIVGHEHSHAMGGFHIGTYENLVYSDPGCTSEWSIFGGSTKRETFGMIHAALDAFYQKRKHDKAVFVPIIAALWCESHNAEADVSKTAFWYSKLDDREACVRAAGDASGRFAATLLTLRRIYGDSEVESWYRDAMAKRECLKVG
jgi:hypothetical protein